MDVTKIPFNNYIGIKYSGNGFLLELEKSDNYLNHINTIHASAQFALAEASSGEFLLRNFNDISDNIIPVVRKVDLKYKKPAEGKIRSKAFMKAEEIEKVKYEINNKGRALLTVKVEIFDQNDNLTLISEFEWFIQKIKS